MSRNGSEWSINTPTALAFRIRGTQVLLPVMPGDTADKVSLGHPFPAELAH
jgi:hypothetical protein